MKKSLTALAVLGVFAGSAMAADVTLYGALDTGFEYFHKKTTQYDGSSEKSDTFDMQTGWDTPSRWVLKTSATAIRSASSLKVALTAMTARWVRTTASSAVKPV